ncbi:hypothetical protein MtrunA17_Chr3g0086201 [Medicago truncatula]|uniref:Transmembrane protein n=1 Tax=Medicago truncatula TaxID=3880 RepID=A0A396IK14_MEDTR|nr:hypothetical protein MtrunA17_Chr3g0086201 [Medicago truncatula]
MSSWRVAQRLISIAAFCLFTSFILFQLIFVNIDKLLFDLRHILCLSILLGYFQKYVPKKYEALIIFFLIV